ncbi:unnamed protein product [Cyprideis torosa]|uniref:Uncharacterized protein n=1 Tax=Cyprideis torosa TaxID=163714 RepID=A0A7R8WMU4_9CRUS|nr:unnamed protein product [Cyprideis torosa]CAG0898861.1 unnamed protein product [Cyprideis torosa]
MPIAHRRSLWGKMKRRTTAGIPTTIPRVLGVTRRTRKYFASITTQ